jgi:c-di-GMP-related signal transduction protein
VDSWTAGILERAMTDFYFARQPVLDGSKSIFGYELLFRNNFQNSYNCLDGNYATVEVLSNALFHSSFQKMVGGKRGLVNFTRDLLLSDITLLFSPDQMIVEVLEDVVSDDEIIEACSRLKKLGYKIALDDFIADNLDTPLLQIADIVKVDFLQSNVDDRKIIAGKLLPRKIMLLAEKVETEDDFRDGLAAGYQLFQGYFFSKPMIRVGQQLAASKIASVRMLQAVFGEQCDYQELNEIVSSDVSLSYRMLKLANSPLFSFREEISSILHAITMMGCSGMRRFVSLFAVGTMADTKPPELILTCLARARIGERISPLIGLGDHAAALYMTGLFSLLDALLDRPMEEIVPELPVAEDIKSALLGEQNKLRAALDAIIAYERGDWGQFTDSAARIGLQKDLFPAIYTSAIEWATNLLRLM